MNLVRTYGIVKNENEIKDSAFGVVAKNSYRLFRVCEIYQIVETSHPKTETKEAYCSYEGKWVTHPIDSSGFHDSSYRNENPSIAKLPYVSIS